jgi:hypothetical protein
MATATATRERPQAMGDGSRVRGYAACGAKTRTGGECGKPAGWGTDHAGEGRCRLHLGSTRNHRRSASVELARQEIRKLGLARGEEPLKIGPAEAMLHALWLAHEDLSLYSYLVHELDTNPGAAGLYGPPTT